MATLSNHHSLLYAHYPRRQTSQSVPHHRHPIPAVGYGLRNLKSDGGALIDDDDDAVSWFVA